MKKCSPFELLVSEPAVKYIVLSARGRSVTESAEASPATVEIRMIDLVIIGTFGCNEGTVRYQMHPKKSMPKLPEFAAFIGRLSRAASQLSTNVSDRQEIGFRLRDKVFYFGMGSRFDYHRLKRTLAARILQQLANVASSLR